LIGKGHKVKKIFKTYNRQMEYRNGQEVEVLEKGYKPSDCADIENVGLQYVEVRFPDGLQTLVCETELKNLQGVQHASR
jgi:hypothetical protein